MTSLLALLATVSFWVATDGNDANGGSAGKPVRTFARALELSRNHLSDEPKEIVFADGVYTFDSMIVLDEKDYDLTIRAQHPGKTVLSGAMKVSGWEADPADGRFLTARLPFPPEPETLYALVVNGACAEFSAYPEFGGSRYLRYNATNADTAKNNRKVLNYDPHSLPKGFTYEGLDLASAFVFLPQEWVSTRLYIATNDWRNNTFHFKGESGMPIGRYNTGYQILNTRLGLTHPGTWMFEATTGRIVYWPREKETAANITAYVSRTSDLFEVTGTHGLRFSGLVMEGCSARFSDGGYGGPKKGNSAVIGGISMHDMVIEDCEIRNTAGGGVRLWMPERCVVRNSRVHHVGASCVEFLNGGSRSEILNCELDHNGLFSLTCAAYVQQSFVKVVGNRIHHSPGNGLVLWSTYSLFASNELHHTMMSLRDGGALYGGYSYTLVKDNYVHDTGDWPGLYNDEGGHDTVLTGNRFERSWWPFHIHECYSVSVTNNTIVGDEGMRMSFQGSIHSIFRDNLIRSGIDITDDPYVAHCDVWDNDVEFVGADGKVKTRKRLVLSRKPLPPKAPARGTRVSGPMFVGTKAHLGVITTPWEGHAIMDRSADGFELPGAPGGFVRFGFDDENLYICGEYNYNKLMQYPGSVNRNGHVWGVHDGVRIHFDGFDVTSFYDGTVVSTDPDLVFTNTNSYISYGWHSPFAFAVPLSKLGLDAKTAPGAEIPINATFYNADHREYKYFTQPDDVGFPGRLFGRTGILSGRLRLSEVQVDYAGLIDCRQRLEGFESATPCPIALDGTVHAVPDTEDAPGGGYDGRVPGYEMRHDEFFGFLQNAGTGLNGFLMMGFTGDDPKAGDRLERHADKGAERGRPGSYECRFQRWAVALDLVSTKNCNYYRWGYDRGGRIKVLIDTQVAGPAWFAKGRTPTNLVSSESSFGADGVFEGAVEAGVGGRNERLFAKIAFEPKPIAVRELPSNGRVGKRYIAEFRVPAMTGNVLVKAAVSGTSAEDARARFEADGATADFAALKSAAVKAWDGYLDAEKPPEKADKKAFFRERYAARVRANFDLDASNAK